MANDLSILGRLRAGMLAASFTQGFGPSALHGEPSYTYQGHTYANFHKGVDLVFAHNATIYSPASGRVIAAGQLPGWDGANVVKIQAPNGFIYTLAHFASINVQSGQVITAGQPVGVQGHTGYTTGDHLHLEITDPQGQPINPGRNPAEVFWTLAHGLGFGQGYQPNAYDENTPPAPGGSANTPAAVLKPLPFQAPGYPTDPYTGSTTSGTGTGTNNGTSGVPGLDQIKGVLNAPGGPIGQAVLAAATNGAMGGDCATAALVLGMLAGGAVLVIIGLINIMHESPAESVITPITQPAGEVVKKAATAAKVAAAV